MGNWDRELIELLPKAVKVFASAGAGFDWVDTGILAEHGKLETVSRGKNLVLPLGPDLSADWEEKFIADPRLTTWI